MRAKMILLTIVAFVAALSLTACDVEGSFKDSRDGKTYKTVKIGGQVWMAENLNYQTVMSKCYENKSENCEKYGRLYSWKEAMTACPDGWHLPDGDDYEELIAFAGRNANDNEKAGTVLKSKVGWVGDKGSDALGFMVLPAGYYRSNRNIFKEVGEGTSFWSSSEIGNGAYSFGFVYDGEFVNVVTERKLNGLSVRCVKNPNEGDSSRATTMSSKKTVSFKDSRDGKIYKTVKIGGQVWMAENLNYQTVMSKCYENKSENCEKYGRLYSWKEAMTACPEGWHLPSMEEFEVLQAAASRIAGDKNKAGIVLKSRGDWKKNNGKRGGDTDALGFAASPAGTYNIGDGSFCEEGEKAHFWSSTEESYEDAYYMFLGEASSEFMINGSYKFDAFSVRCIENSSEGISSEAVVTPPKKQKTMTDPRDGSVYKTIKIGDKVWMAENLHYLKENKYNYYDWWEAMMVCPEGWYLPSEGDFNELRGIAGRITGKAAGTVLKSKTGWFVKSWSNNGSDALGFAAFPAGSDMYNSSYFEREGAFFWSSTEYDRYRAYRLRLNYNSEHAYVDDDVNKKVGSSVRCIKNSNEELASDKSLTRPSKAGATSPQSVGDFGQLVDSRDGKTYKTVKIGDKIWMAENLNFDYNHGTAKSFCYEEEPKKCDKYGRFYAWAAAMDSAAIYGKDGARCGYGKECDAMGKVRGVCPDGWYLPSKEDFEELCTIAGLKVGDFDKAGTALYSMTGWALNDGTNALGFAALPTGHGSYGDIFGGAGKSAYFWSSTESDGHHAYFLLLGYHAMHGAAVYHNGSSIENKDDWNSVRCVKNSN